MSNEIKERVKIPALFLAGGIVYCAIEIIACGKTHFSMLIVGGICFILIGLLNKTKRVIPVTVQMLISAGIITVLELISGLILNVWLKLNIWDYAPKPYDFMGQICLKASATWVFVSLIAILINAFAREKMFGEEKARLKLLP